MVLKHASRADAKRPSDERQMSSDNGKDELRKHVLVLEHELGEKNSQIQQLMRQYQSHRILLKMSRQGVQSVLDDANDLYSLVLLRPDDPARRAVLPAVREWKKEEDRKKAEKERKEESERKRQRQSYAMETRPEHVAIGKGATMVHWVVTSGE